MANKVTYILELRDRYSQYAKKIAVANGAMVRSYDKAIKKARQLQQQMLKTTAALRRAGAAMRQVGGQIGMGLSAPILLAGGFAIKTAAEFEQMGIAIKTLAGDASVGAKLMNDLKVFAAKTPFELKGLTKGAQTLIGMGDFSANKIIPIMEKLGNVAAGTGADIQSLAFEFAQIKSKGKADAIDLKQLALRGFNVLGVIQKMAAENGKVISIEQLKEYGSQGLITFDVVAAALDRVTQKGGRFHGLMAAQSQTLTGLFSNFRDNVDFAGDSIGQTIIKLFDLKNVLRGLTENVGQFAAWFNKVAETHPGITKVALALAGIVAIAGPLLIIIGAMATGVSALAAAFGFLSGAAIIAALPFIAIGLAIIAVVAAIKALIDNWDTIVAKMKEGGTFVMKMLGLDTESAMANSSVARQAEATAANLNGGGITDTLDVNLNVAEGITAQTAQSSGGRSGNRNRNMNIGLNNLAAL